MSDQTFDIVVLGGGSAGYAAALRATELGLSVAMIEKDKVGGTCLHRGCVPTKALLHSAEVADAAREGALWGINTVLEGVDIKGVTEFRENLVAKKYKGLQGLLGMRKVTTIAGDGRLTSPNTVEVWTPTFSNRRPRMSAMVPPPPGAPVWSVRAQGWRSNRPGPAP